MRQAADNGKISVVAVAGTHAVLLGMDATPEAAKGLLGFAIHRENRTDNRARWLSGYLTFPDAGSAEGQHRSDQQPFQDFKWGDYSTEPGNNYTYNVVPMYGRPGQLQQGDSVTVDVTTESVNKGTHRIFFNRGAASSQHFAFTFGNLPEAELAAQLKQPGSDALMWLSRGLEAGLLEFIAQAKDARFGLRAAVYEFEWNPVLAAFGAVSKAGADVKIVFDSRKPSPKPTCQKCGTELPLRASRAPTRPPKPPVCDVCGRSIRPPARSPVDNSGPAMAEARIQGLGIPRKAPPLVPSHNKFIVLLEDQQPRAVWTGSTNITRGGIFGHSNVGHAVWDPDVAKAYLEYWNELSKDPAHDDMAAFNGGHAWGPGSGAAPPAIEAVFSPRPTLDTLTLYADLLAHTTQVAFVTLPFGICDQFEEVLASNDGFLCYLLMDSTGQSGNRKNFGPVVKKASNRVAVGAELPEGVLKDWQAEHDTELNDHVKFIHTKYMVVDPLSNNPIVISGSANFSTASTLKNDENMLIIRGDTRVSDIYVTEFMRLWSHYYFRDRQKQALNRAKTAGRTTEPQQLFLDTDDSWTRKYYEPGSVRERERLYFSGKLG